MTLGRIVALVMLVLVSLSATFGGGPADAADAPPRAAGGTDEFERLRPPLLQLVSAAGRQDAVRGSSCVSSVDANGEGVGLCIDTLRPYPERLTVVDPSDEIALELLEGNFTEPATVIVTRLGCTDEVAHFTLADSGDSWPVDLAPGAYGLDAFFLFQTAPGLSGDSFQALGLLVEPLSEPEIVPATSRGFVCPREYRPQLVKGGTRAQRAVLTSVLDRVTASFAPDIRIAKPPKRWRPQAGTWLRIGVATRPAANAVLHTWQGLLAVGAFRDIGRARDLPRLAGYALDVAAPPGRHERRPADGPRPASAPNASEIRETVVDAAAAADVRLDSLVVLRPLGPAPVVIVTVSDPASFLRGSAVEFLAALRTLVDGAGPAADGLYVEMRDGTGQPFKITAVGTRAGSGATWIREDLAALETAGPVGARAAAEAAQTSAS